MDYKQSSASCIKVTLRNPTDLSPRRDGIRHGSALRIFDHHMYVLLNALKCRPGKDDVVKDMDQYCVAQSCTTYDKSRMWSISEELDRCQAFIWIESVNRTSIVYMHALVANYDDDDCAAEDIISTARRVLVLVDAKSGRPIPLHESMKNRVEPYIIMSGRISSHERVVLKLVHNLMRENSSTQELVPVPVDSLKNKDSIHCLTVTLGFQHINEGHIDHAALADISIQAFERSKTDFLSIQNREILRVKGKEFTNQSFLGVLALRYFSPPIIGADVQCYVDGSNITIFQDSQLLVQAKFTSLLQKHHEQSKL